jgi:hypothetical protein
VEVESKEEEEEESASIAEREAGAWKKSLCGTDVTSLLPLAISCLDPCHLN